MKDGTKEIVTNNLILRKFKEEDYIEMYDNWASNPHVATSAGWPVHTDINSTKNLIKMWVDEYNEDNVFNWIVVEKISNKAIGSITVVSKDLDNKVCEIGYNIGESWWNKGYGTEAIKNVIDYLFSLEMFDVITAACFVENIASIRVLEKNEFKQEGILRNRIIYNNEIKSLRQFSLLREEYNK